MTTCVSLLPLSVSPLLYHLQVLRVLLDRLGKVPQPLMHIAEGDVDERSGARHPSPCGGCCRPGAVKHHRTINCCTPRVQECLLPPAASWYLPSKSSVTGAAGRSTRRKARKALMPRKKVRVHKHKFPPPHAAAASSALGRCPVPRDPSTTPQTGTGSNALMPPERRTAEKNSNKKKQSKQN